MAGYAAAGSQPLAAGVACAGNNGDTMTGGFFALCASGDVELKTSWRSRGKDCLAGNANAACSGSGAGESNQLVSLHRSIGLRDGR